ncbi:UNVERIFIED_CONTAM: ubiquitin-protein ligase peroxin 12 [Siphonaria sp. JEL0065]|nr:ubiquitin-protein ligase peroxin 12 [Siphonaria sp. JEL0065]
MDNRPSLFELVAADQLQAMVKPAIRYILAWYAQQNVLFALPIARLVSNWFDEVFCVASVLVETTLLASASPAGVAERFYGLKRVSAESSRSKRRGSGGVKLTKGQLVASLIHLAVLPLIKSKLEDAFESAKEKDVSDRTRFEQCVVSVFPFFDLIGSLLKASTTIAYLFNKTDSHSPINLAVGLAVVRMGQNDYVDATTTQPHPDGIALPQDPSQCPICLSEVKNPAMVPTGYVYCYPCIYKYIEKHAECPVTKVSLMGKGSCVRKLYASS